MRDCRTFSWILFYDSRCCILMGTIGYPKTLPTSAQWGTLICLDKVMHRDAFSNVIFKYFWKFLKSEKDISKYFELQIKESSEENRNLIREVFNHTPSPQYIRGITTSFAGDVIGGRFAAVEWNFGDEDWLHECLDLHNLDQDHVERCKKLRIAKKSTDLNKDYKDEIFNSFINLLPVCISGPNFRLKTF